MVGVGPGGVGARRVVVEQAIFVIAANDGPALGNRALDHLRRERPPVDQVARRDEVIDRELRQIGQHRLQRGQIAVDIGDNRDPRQRETPFGGSITV